MKAKKLSSTEVKNRFGRVLREITQTGNPIIVQRGNKSVAVIMSMAEYERFFSKLLTNNEEAETLIQNSFGMWGNREIDDEWLKDGRSRWESNWADG
ncbi:MAG: type II toxin-antitoxin system Phd/YefM family antitoxin [Chloroflexi bacterium]|nr:MAG: type II toxin-antitoxin system Phd/YefM family antitoxin [Chloroflexota bacterium]